MSVTPAKKFHPLLARYLVQLALNPLRTKALTTGVLTFLQEVLGSSLAGVPVRPTKDTPPIARTLAHAHINVKAFKMGLYGLLVSAPLSHFLVGKLQKAFSGKTSPAAKIGQVLANNLLVAPVQTVVYLASMAIINGATSLKDIRNTVKAGFFSVISVTWVVSPVSLVLAQRFIPIELWVPFFSAIQFSIGTYFNFRAKHLRLKALKKEKDRDNRRPSQ